jgi:hypothetical protein
MQIAGQIIFVAGAVGWFVAAFIQGPIRRFFDLREEVIWRMALYANVSAREKENREEPNEPIKIEISDEAAQRLAEAELSIRTMAAKMRAFAINETLAVWFVRLLRYDPFKASQGLFGLSNSIGISGGTKAFQKKTIEQALFFVIER